MAEKTSGSLGPAREDFQKSFTHQGVKPQGDPPSTRPTQSPTTGSASQHPVQPATGSGTGKK
ncbi:MAG: hypothetical protein GW893_19880 [Armatimonadetes bacterium]|nr:hypothetical protein [Armatimonadota bacterium]